MAGCQPVSTNLSPVDFSGDIAKVDEEAGRFWGWSYVVSKDGEQVEDHSGDVVDTPEAVGALESAFYNYVLDSREGDDMHRTFGLSRLIEAAFITKDKAEMMGMTATKEGMWVGFEVDRSSAEGQALWGKIKSGERAALSIVGSGHRVAIET